MGRKANYNQKKEKDERTAEEIISKGLNHEELTPEDFAKILLTDPKTVKNQIKRFCDLNHEEFSIEDFKNKGKYIFPPEWHGLLLTLLAATGYHSEFDKRSKQELTIENYLNYTDKLLEGIDQYIDETTRNEVALHPLYARAKVERELYQQIEKKLQSAISTIGMMPAQLRFNVLSGIHQALDSWKLHLVQLYTSHMIEEAMNKRNNKETNMDESLELTLEGLLVLYLKKNMKMAHVSVELNSLIEDTVEEQDFFNALFNELVMDRWKSETNELIEKQTKAVQDQIRSIPSNKEILEKVKSVLEESKPKEKQVLHWIELLLRAEYLSNRDGGDNSRAARVLLDKLVTHNTWEQLNKFTK